MPFLFSLNYQALGQVVIRWKKKLGRAEYIFTICLKCQSKRQMPAKKKIAVDLNNLDAVWQKMRDPRKLLHVHIKI